MARTTTAARPAQQGDQQPKPQNAVILAPPRMQAPADVFTDFPDITPPRWRALVESVFPLAQTPGAVYMALAYCDQRKLDVFKKVVHIVPTYVRGKRVEQVWPGIAEVRTTASRTGQYAGLDEPVFGPMIKATFKGKVEVYNDHGPSDWKDAEVELEYPEWCRITVYKLVQGNARAFPGPKTYFREFYGRANRKFELPNERWTKSPVQMLEKCAEAGALRRAFPEEIGDQWTAEEAEGRATEAIDVTDQGSATTPAPTSSEPRRSDYQPTEQQPQDAEPEKKPEPEKKEPPQTAQQNATPREERKDPPRTAAGKPITDVDQDTGEIKETGKPVPDPEADRRAAEEAERYAAAGQPEDDDDIPFGDDPAPAAQTTPGAKEYPPEYWLPDRPLTFASFSKAGLFSDWSEPFLENTNPEGARQWLKFYSNTLRSMSSGNPGMQKAARDLRATAEAKIKQPDDPPKS